MRAGRETSRGVRAPIRVGLGLAAGLAAGSAAEGLSSRYADPDRGGLRVTAHAALPFLVAGVRARGSGSRRAALWRAGFIGAHLVHVRQIALLLQAGGTRDPEVRAALGLGGVGYSMVMAQAALLGGPVRSWAGAGRADGWSESIDTSLLRAYAAACLGGLVRHRRPVVAYVLIAALLALGFASKGAVGEQVAS